jgi:hypothetical protein
MTRTLIASLAFLLASMTAQAADLGGGYGEPTSPSDNSDIAARHQAWWDRGRVPECDGSSVLGSVAQRGGLGNGTFDRVRESRFLQGELTDRRYCEARITMADGQHSYVYYLIEERQGFASLGWNVEFCVPGRDPWHVYDGWCRAIRR